VHFQISWIVLYTGLSVIIEKIKGRRGRDRMVVMQSVPIITNVVVEPR
jgi:hypothetical protein